VHPNLPAHSRRTSNPPIPANAFAQVTGLRPQNHDGSQKQPFRYPHQVYEKGLRPTFPQVRGLLAHVVAGEGFEPSKLSRWIYSPRASSL
jgi:hypothetical protein